MNMISIGLSGTLAAQLALNASSNNLANLMTPGYSRQGVLIASLAAGGVYTPALIRFNDAYKTQQLWASNSQAGHYNASQTYLDQLEAAFGGGDASGDLSLGMGALFSALQAASGDPTASANRNGVLYAANGMCQAFNNMSRVFSDQVSTLEQQRQSTVDQVNGLSKSIADLNKQIAAAQASGSDTSALQDQRDHAIDRLSEYADVRVVMQDNGTADVSLAGGQPLVAGSKSATMSVERDGNGLQQISVQFGNQTFGVPADKLGGALAGLHDYETQTLRPQMQALNELKQQFAQTFNDQLAAGYDMNGRPGKPLFVYDPASGNLNIDSSVTADDLAFSSDPNGPANTDNLLKLIDVESREVTLDGLGTVKFGSATAAMSGAIGAASQKNQQSAHTAGAVRAQAVAAWQSVSGVNQDEEAVSLVQYQQMYQANMKVISVANQLFQTVMDAV
ncbi:flagellar hook-associated protein FlgK [Trinickia mobilis]|uniref:flagellar hook-associated protein FlgK n=1 Tax=Trinickia mobilis TaxID=2816356 RepID=UPI001A8C3E91|nr:flagellar hook-associated protein FlgK [Trinickia mobilis]